MGGGDNWPEGVGSIISYGAKILGEKLGTGFVPVAVIPKMYVDGVPPQRALRF